MLDHATAEQREIVACCAGETPHMRLDVFVQVVAGSTNRRFLVAVRAGGRVERWAESFGVGEDATEHCASTVEPIQFGGGQAASGTSSWTSSFIGERRARRRRWSIGRRWRSDVGAGGESEREKARDRGDGSALHGGEPRGRGVSMKLRRPASSPGSRTCRAYVERVTSSSGVCHNRSSQRC